MTMILVMMGNDDESGGSGWWWLWENMGDIGDIGDIERIMGHCDRIRVILLGGWVMVMIHPLMYSGLLLAYM